MTKFPPVLEVNLTSIIYAFAELFVGVARAWGAPSERCRKSFTIFLRRVHTASPAVIQRYHSIWSDKGDAENVEWKLVAKICERWGKRKTWMCPKMSRCQNSHQFCQQSLQLKAYHFQKWFTRLKNTHYDGSICCTSRMSLYRCKGLNACHRPHTISPSLRCPRSLNRQSMFKKLVLLHNCRPCDIKQSAYSARKLHQRMEKTLYLHVMILWGNILFDYLCNCWLAMPVIIIHHLSNCPLL